MNSLATAISGGALALALASCCTECPHGGPGSGQTTKVYSVRASPTSVSLAINTTGNVVIDACACDAPPVKLEEQYDTNANGGKSKWKSIHYPASQVPPAYATAVLQATTDINATGSGVLGDAEIVLMPGGKTYVEVTRTTNGGQPLDERLVPLGLGNVKEYGWEIQLALNSAGADSAIKAAKGDQVFGAALTALSASSAEAVYLQQEKIFDPRTMAAPPGPTEYHLKFPAVAVAPFTYKVIVRPDVAGALKIAEVYKEFLWEGHVDAEEERQITSP